MKQKLQRVLGKGPRHAGVTLGASGYQWAASRRRRYVPRLRRGGGGHDGRG